MKLAIMQPYFFPYIGYFQMINSVDEFVVYDNIQYTKKGWFNRNKILVNGQPTYITIPIQKDSDSLDVNQRKISRDFNSTKILAQIENSYRKSESFHEIFPLLQLIITNRQNNLFEYIKFTIEECCKYLSIDTKIINSSSINIDHTLKGGKKVLAICQALNTEKYINAIGGKELYFPLLMCDLY